MSEKNEADIRYSRLVTLPEIGREGVKTLNNASILIIGCGALGSLCAMYLAASGVGHLTIADLDTIDISNLQRQLFFTEDALGKSKARILKEKIQSLNSGIEVKVIEKFLTADLARKMVGEYDVVIDGSDNPDTKLMTDRVCREAGVACIIGGVRGFSGQVMTITENSTGYAEIFGDAPSCGGFTPCSVSGVLGPAAGIIASVQAAEAIKLITGAGRTLADRLLNINLLDMSVSVLELS